MRFAPSIPVGAKPATVSPVQIVAETMARFGDRSLIRDAHLAPLPEVVRAHYRGWVGPAPQPRHPLWILLDVTGGEEPSRGADAAAIAQYDLARWEVSLFGAGVRDKLCLAQARPMIGWSSTARLMGFFNAGAAIAQRFPNASRATLRRRAQLVAERRGFELAQLRFVRPFQDAPIVVFRTNDRKRFANDVATITKFLNPTTNAAGQTALTYEGLYLEGDDMNGKPFLVTAQTWRGEVSGSQWAWDPCFLPYEHSSPALAPKSQC